jgi:hypothetical protein
MVQQQLHQLKISNYPIVLDDSLRRLRRLASVAMLMQTFEERQRQWWAIVMRQHDEDCHRLYDSDDEYYPSSCI